MLNMIGTTVPLLEIHTNILPLTASYQQRSCEVIQYILEVATAEVLHLLPMCDLTGWLRTRRVAIAKCVKR